MAQRDEPGIKQCCVLCTTYFCNLYYPPCAKIGTKLQLVSARRESCQIDVELLRGNSFEFDCLRRYLQDKKCTSKDVFDYMLK